jgi:hypothetical protein
LHSFLIGNPNITADRRTKLPVPTDYWSNAGNINPALYELTVSEFLTDTGNVKNSEEIREILGEDLSRERYENIKKIISGSLMLAEKQKIMTNYPGPVNILEFCQSFKKGSKPFRKIIEFAKNNRIKLRQIQKVKTFFNLINIPVLEENELEQFSSEWSFPYYIPKIRDFIFKFRSNLLGLNTRVSHFNANIDRGCTFCKKTVPVPNPVPDENFLHLFFECNKTKEVLNKFLNKYLFDFNCDTDEKKKLFVYTGTNCLTGSIDNRFIRALSVHFCFYIWECKLQKRLPMAESLYNDLFYSVENMRKASAMLQQASNLNLHICRNWAVEASSRH